jgi:hypothetical protein
MSPFFPGECPEDRVLLFHALGLTEEADEARLAEHVRSCASCGMRQRDLGPRERRPEFGARVGHVPPDLLSKWPGIRTSLSEHANATVERHLARCLECTEDFDRLSRMRALPIDESAIEAAEREFAIRPPEDEFLPSESPMVAMRSAQREAGATGDAEGASTAALDHLNGEIRGHAFGTTPRARGPRRGVLLLGGYATLATAAAIVFALREPLEGGGPAPTPGGGRNAVPGSVSDLPRPGPSGDAGVPIEGSSGGGPETTAPTAKPAVRAAAREWQVRLLPREPRLLTSVMRGDEGTVPTLDQGRDAGTLVVRIEPMFPVADDAPMRIEILDAQQRVLAGTDVRWKELHGGGTIFLSTGGTRLPSGRYVLRVRTRGRGASGTADAEAIDYPFVLSGS